MVRRVNDDLMHAIAAARGAPTDGSDGTVMRLADDQFNVLVDLLTPGYELALAYKAQIDTPAPTFTDPEPAHPSDPTPEPIAPPTEPPPAPAEVTSAGTTDLS